MRTTDRFHLQRKQELSSVFGESILAKTWRKIVKKQMRSMDLLDLHDYYDFNYNIEIRAKHISKQILSGRYKTSLPLTYTIEKRLGICRHMTLPSPSDALVLQAIVESIADDIRSTEKTGKAYYSRDKHNMKLPHEVREPGEYEMRWIEQWRNFQKDIYDFSKEYDYLVVTDLTNYFDSIGLRELRHMISARVGTSEVVLDFLFSLIEQLSWSPDYLPTSLKGLPTIPLEAPRLLAHSMLFEIDDILDSKTNGSFVRWMDDINFGVDSVDDACSILGSINEVLKSRGLALNLSKTALYTSSEVEGHFLVAENRYLEEFEDRRNAGEKKGVLAKELYYSFRRHMKNDEAQNWGKINKRYLTAAARVGTTRLLKPAISFFKKQPGIRSNVAYYIQKLGPKSQTKKAVLRLMQETSFYDDISSFHLVRTLTAWKLSRNEEDKHFVSSVHDLLKNPSSVFEMYCYLWFAAKYAEPSDLLSVIVSKKSLWQHEPFLARQVVSVLPRARRFRSDIVGKMLEEQISNGPNDASSVAHNILFLEGITSLEKRHSMYVFPDSIGDIYPLSKFLILLAMIESPSIRSDKIFLKRMKKYLSDPWMLHWTQQHLALF